MNDDRDKTQPIELPKPPPQNIIFPSVKPVRAKNLPVTIAAWLIIFWYGIIPLFLLILFIAAGNPFDGTAPSLPFVPQSDIYEQESYCNLDPSAEGC